MRILAVLGPKGGIGKTTIAANLLVAARMKGLDAAGLDLDGQGTFARWAVKRAADGRHPKQPLRLAHSAHGGRLSQRRGLRCWIRRRAWPGPKSMILLPRPTSS